MKRPIDYSEQIHRLYYDENPNLGVCRTVTFVVTESCPLVCSYCYQGCKSNKFMSFDTAKKIVDLLFKMSETDDSTFINTKTKAVILDFIGNYKNNFMIPIALSGDRSYNKDNIRRYLMEGGRVIPGASTIHFDEISRKRIFAAASGR